MRADIEESVNIASLHNQIAACDEILERMENMLKTFQEDLGSISHEILTLQQQSVSMNVRLKNRQAVRGELSQFVDDIIVPEAMINFIKQLQWRLKIELLYVFSELPNFTKEKHNKRLKTDSFLSKLHSVWCFRCSSGDCQDPGVPAAEGVLVRKPTTNYQVPQNAMLKHKFCYQFLMTHEREIAREIRDEYVDTMGKILFSYFKSYTNRLMKLQYPFESLFRSQQYALLDNACREYLFVTEFFMCSGSAAQDLFNLIMSKTLTMFLKHVELYVQDCYDSIALFLCIHIIHRFQLLMHERSVPALDRQVYWESLLQFLYPRFEYILRLNIQSIRDCDPQKLGSIDMRPHYITRRYAEFSAAVVSINENFPSERVASLLAALQGEVENFILKMAAEFQGRKEQLIFLINNYDMMLSVLLERTKEDSKETESFKELLNARTQEYVEEILAPHFGGMISFVKECELLQERGQADVMQREETLMQLIQYYHRFQKVLSQAPFKQLTVRTELLNIHHLMVEVKKYKPNF
ncbi:hypothetical protein HPB47_021262 [Ixodes persulcatus]|uniref:Uncharacterized protein n=1 Tax=Ixodes persulcatus TaxID=34615 RepID=A0AC60QGE8_IXOPE|nr:hypothetical protein HPB47_021262 [Ixodes persulcatus]